MLETQVASGKCSTIDLIWSRSSSLKCSGKYIFSPFINSLSKPFCLKNNYRFKTIAIADFGSATHQINMPICTSVRLSVGHSDSEVALKQHKRTTIVLPLVLIKRYRYAKIAKP